MKRHPPGPRRLPIIGHLLRFGSDPIRFFEECARDYGDVVSLRIGSWPALFLNHPDHFENVLLTNNRNFIKHRFFFRHVTEIFGKGLLTNEGAPWLRQRRLMQPAFHRERIAAYGATMRDSALRMLERWPPHGTRDLHEDFMALTMEIATKTLFGAELPPERAAEISAAVTSAIEEIARRFRRPMKVPAWLPVASNRRYDAALARVDGLIYDFIDAKERGGNGSDDLLTMLLAVRDEDGSGMDRRQVRDEAITIFLAGHETTAITLSWTMYLLARHPEIQEKAAKGSAEYLSHVVSESMRLYPPAYAIGREAVEDCEIGGYRVAAGTTLFIVPWVIHRDARFFDDSMTFRPERWENDFAKTLPRFAYLPFGGGPRVCIGNNFALMETSIVLAELLRRYQVSSPGPVDPLASITLRPKQGMPLAIQSRT